MLFRSTAISSLRVVFNIAANFNRCGVLINSHIHPQDNHYVGYNAFDNLSGGGTAVTLTRNTYGLVEGNSMTRVGVGVRIESCDKPTSLLTASAVRENTIRSERAGIVVNDYFHSGAPLDVRGNTITTDANGDNNIGLYLTGVRDCAPVTMATNHISGAYEGVKAYNCHPAATKQTLSQSILRHNTYDVHVLDEVHTTQIIQLTLDNTAIFPKTE